MAVPSQLPVGCNNVRAASKAGHHPSQATEQTLNSKRNTKAHFIIWYLTNLAPIVINLASPNRISIKELVRCKRESKRYVVENNKLGGPASWKFTPIHSWAKCTTLANFATMTTLSCLILFLTVSQSVNANSSASHVASLMTLQTLSYRREKQTESLDTSQKWPLFALFWTCCQTAVNFSKIRMPETMVL